MRYTNRKPVGVRSKPIARITDLAIISMAGVLLSSTGFAESLTRHELKLIDEGFRIFTEETFEGNGRTCGTCHVPEQQYSIGPDFIATLSDAEKDLLMAVSVPGLENPTLAETLGVFNTGPGDATVEYPEGPFRSAQQVTAMNATTLDFFGTRQRLGWGGDGSPSGDHHGNVDGNADGSLRAFANGAIAQHATKTMGRIAKTTACSWLDVNDPDAYCGAPYDFRFATDFELDAMDAFQRSIGRRAADGTPGCGATARADALNTLCTEEYIDTMPVGGKSEFTLVAFDPGVLQTGPADHEMVFYNPLVSQGKTIFQSDQASCFLCHQNGGAHFGNNGRPHGNLERNQGLDDFRFALSAATGVNIPADPGNGATAGAQPAAINLQTIIEASRRTQFGHNHAIEGFEEMVGEGFHKPFVRDLDPDLHCVGIVGTGAPGREGLIGSSNANHSDSEECLEETHGKYAVTKMATFLRALSAWYAFRDVERLVAETCHRIDLGVSTDQSVREAEFALQDAAFSLIGPQAHPKPHESMPRTARRLKDQLAVAAHRKNKHWLRRIHDKAQYMRDSIATTTQEDPRSPVCY